MKAINEFINESILNEAKDERLGEYTTAVQGDFNFKKMKRDNMTLRFNPREARFEVFGGVGRGFGKPAMFIINCSDESKGVEIVRLLQDKYATGQRTLTYQGTSYGF